MTARIDTGFSNPREHFEFRVTPVYSDFLKLKSRENAISAAVALWEMHDHLWVAAHPGTSKRSAAFRSYNRQLMTRCPELRLIQDIAEGSKHVDLERPSVQVVGISGAGSPGGKLFVSDQFGTNETVPPCTLQIDLRDGTSRSMEDVLSIAAKFLRAELP